MSGYDSDDDMSFITVDMRMWEAEYTEEDLLKRDMEQANKEGGETSGEPMPTDLESHCCHEWDSGAVYTAQVLASNSKLL